MRFFPLAYKTLAEQSGFLVSQEEFLDFFANIERERGDETFHIDNAMPGGAGSIAIYRALVEASGVDENITWRK